MLAASRYKHPQLARLPLRRSFPCAKTHFALQSHWHHHCAVALPSVCGLSGPRLMTVRRPYLFPVSSTTCFGLLIGGSSVVGSTVTYWWHRTSIVGKRARCRSRCVEFVAARVQLHRMPTCRSHGRPPSFTPRPFRLSCHDAGLRPNRARCRPRAEIFLSQPGRYTLKNSAVFPAREWFHSRQMGYPDGYPRGKKPVWRVSEWLAATLEMSCRETGCGFESHALRFDCSAKTARGPEHRRPHRPVR